MTILNDHQTAAAELDKVVHVSLAGRGYDILIGRDLLSSAGKRMAQACCSSTRADGRAAVVVTDPAVQPLYGQGLIDSLQSAGFSVTSVCLAGGETHKTLATVERIYDVLQASASDRRTVVVALGGGVVGDIAGFAAASYQRGLDFVQIPTTLLAQVDSSVGGKVGVNYGLSKNLIGAFHQPKLVLIDADTLATLPLSERRSGIAEVIKYGAIADAPLFELLDREIDALLELSSDELISVIARSCEIKARIVEQDERETTGARATLNFGHTIGHALESVTDYKRYRHGEAIALGMVTACLIGEALNVTPPEVTSRIVALLAAAGFKTAPDTAISPESIIKLLGHDKKSIAGAARFVLLEAIGSATPGHPVPTEVVYAALARQQEIKTG